MAVKAVTTLCISLMAMCLQLALSDNHLIKVMCINETHHALYHDGHVDEPDEDEASNEDDEDDANMTERRRLDSHMDMSEWIVMHTNSSHDPCGTEACNATCTATSCSPMECMVPPPDHATTITTTQGVVNIGGAVPAAVASAILPLLSSMLAWLSI
mmetsp:Transcript_44262/g.102239  ORF Transcript_44262/g.102239 Transcript_44262/m.102239 type:complete len:157 (+) Transcript_44262:68-538(+)